MSLAGSPGFPADWDLTTWPPISLSESDLSLLFKLKQTHLKHG